MRLSCIFTATLLLPLLCIPQANGNNLSLFKQQTNNFSLQLKEFYASNNTVENFSIERIHHDYLIDHSLVFHIHSNINKLFIKQNTPQATSDLSSATTEKQNLAAQKDDNHTPKNQKELTELRLTAKNQSHQEFSLSKKISALQLQSSKTTDEETLTAIDHQIRTAQDKMSSLKIERKKTSSLLNNKKMEIVMTEPATKGLLSRNTLYKELLKQTYQLLCNNNVLLENKTTPEKISFIFDAFSQQDNGNISDEVIIINKDIIKQCNNNEITPQQAINTSIKYQY